MKKLTTALLILISFSVGNDIEVSQDTLMQYLNYGETADRTITVTNNTPNDIDLTISLIDQTWIPPLTREPHQEGLAFWGFPKNIFVVHRTQIQRIF